MREDGDPNSNKWLHIKMAPKWISYKAVGEENLFRITLSIEMINKKFYIFRKFGEYTTKNTR